MGMDPHLKDDARHTESIRISKIVARIASMGGWCLLVPCRWVKWVFVRVASPAEVRAADKAHQSAVRRELRGLPAKHDESRNPA